MLVEQVSIQVMHAVDRRSQAASDIDSHVRRGIRHTWRELVGLPCPEAFVRQVRILLP